MIRIEKLYPLMLEAFKEGKSFTFPVKGTSMQPMLHTSDTVTIFPKNDYNVGDIVLFKRSDDTFVLHRIIRINIDSYDIVGDHQTNIEKNVKKENVVGYVTSYCKKGDSKINYLNNFKYRIYKKIVKY
ncbi:MAG: S24/S26 family peptidase, partial [Anaeroplasma sp.]